MQFSIIIIILERYEFMGMDKGNIITFAFVIYMTFYLSFWKVTKTLFSINIILILVCNVTWWVWTYNLLRDTNNINIFVIKNLCKGHRLVIVVSCHLHNPATLMGVFEFESWLCCLHWSFLLMHRLDCNHLGT